MNRALWYRRFGQPEAVLSLETAPLATPAAAQVQVQMIAAPINPSDVIPITGAYAHRVQPPRVAGYEGLGRVVATSDALPFSLGQHVLPLRGDGTWQQRLNCSGQWLVAVPEDIADDIALRGYINPLAARLMLRRWPVRDQQIILTAAGSDCARLLGQWALAGGARRVIGLHRAPQHAPRLRRLGIQPLAMHRESEILRLAAQSSLVFDAVGGRLGGALLAALRPCATLISYGLLSGQPLPVTPGDAMAQRFHLRDALAGMSAADWQAEFAALWPLLRRTQLSPLAPFPLSRWREALMLFYQSGRAVKPLLWLA
ncbi:zinc-dependent alcohol dehydrogenase family protein [Candidatus Sodalis sp. SoCistrobi]|uniref:zinc-dependent alcohol dehydrogenase family protein n=1 Tax=Candidatus Sodalis sp. SoCistrobi TaxID=1922216 RepID=UPI0009390096|nr:zinc-dependent alcohol dehydrogenase family protein [Candidatus Sodalis sp. SoCistrobi]